MIGSIYICSPCYRRLGEEVLVEYLLDLDAISEHPDVWPVDLLDLAFVPISYDVELVRDVPVLVYVEAVQQDSLDAASAVGAEDDEDHSPRCLLGVLGLVLVAYFVQVLVEEVRQLVLSALLVVFEGEVAQVEHAGQDLLEVKHHVAPSTHHM